MDSLDLFWERAKNDNLKKYSQSTLLEDIYLELVNELTIFNSFDGFWEVLCQDSAAAYKFDIYFEN